MHEVHLAGCRTAGLAGMFAPFGRPCTTVPLQTDAQSKLASVDCMTLRNLGPPRVGMTSDQTSPVGKVCRLVDSPAFERYGETSLGALNDR